VSRCTHLRATWPRCTAQNTSISPTSGHHPSHSSHPMPVYTLHTTTTVVVAEGMNMLKKNHIGKGKATAASDDHSSHCGSLAPLKNQKSKLATRQYVWDLGLAAHLIAIRLPRGRTGAQEVI
jgi:hypothetical protein